MPKLQFGIYTTGGALIIPFGAPVRTSTAQAELIAIMLEDAVKDTLQDGDYVAYDYV